MIKQNLKILILTSIVILLPILAGVALWDQLPEQIPMHWNISGEVDGWSSKPFAVLAMPLILLALQWLGMLIMLNDPKRQNQSPKIRQLSFWIIPAVALLLPACIYSTAMGKTVRLEIIVPVSLGLLFTVIGNYMPKCKQNYTVGIKLPWTLHSEENWNKTHRFAGRVWLVGGVIITVGGFFGSFFITLAVAPLMALLPILYSFMLHRKGV